MTEKATSKGHSWLWASHIRTKQSKWLEQNLQDMEDKVENVLNLITKDGDSFARRAEMYYKHRPEVISFVEETARGYRSLAERYDKLSTELQKANTTIATICPEKVTYGDDDDYTVGPSKPKKPTQKAASKRATKIPKAPKLPAKGVLSTYSKKTINDSTKDDQLKSCEETIKMLQDKQEQLSQEAKVEQQRFEETKAKLEALKHKFNLNEDETNTDKSGSCETEVEETIDKFVNKMITLETSVTSQTTLADTLKKENHDLQTRIQNLEAEKAAMMNTKNVVNVESKVGKTDQVSWLEMLLNGYENKDDILLEQYITILKSYRDTKKRLSDEQIKNQQTLSSMKSAIVKRDESIQQMIQKLKHLQESLGEDKVDIPSVDFLDEPQVVSASEEKLRRNIDAILDQNLDLWLRLSTTFRQVHKFKKQVKDLQEEVKKVEARGLSGESNTSTFTRELLSEIKPIYKHLNEINTRLTSWLQQSISLNDELDMINSCLCNIQEEITQEEIKFSAHQAAKFKSEILNMKQENNKVNEELEAGLDHAIALKHEIEQTLERLEMKFGLSANQNKPPKGRSSRRSLSLRSLLFGSKSKQQKFSSLFSCLGHHKRTRSM
ncbi:putative protein Networked (NET), actin-binding (NAB) [Helianthus anomalus]